MASKRIYRCTDTPKGTSCEIESKTPSSKPSVTFKKSK